MKALILITSSVITVFGIGCAALSTIITPADIDTNAVKYAGNAGVADVNDFAGYPNLYKAEKLQTAVNNAHNKIQLSLAQQMELDKLTYASLKASIASSIAASREREEILFGEKGLLSLGLSLAGFGTLTGALGYFRKRPQDLTKDEVDKLIADVTGKTTGELTEKEKALTQVVLGVQKFIDTYQNREAVEALKQSFQQDLETRTIVAEIKAANPA